MDAILRGVIPAFLCPKMGAYIRAYRTGQKITLKLCVFRVKLVCGAGLEPTNQARNQNEGIQEGRNSQSQRWQSEDLLCRFLVMRIEVCNAICRLPGNAFGRSAIDASLITPGNERCPE